MSPRGICIETTEADTMPLHTRVEGLLCPCLQQFAVVTAVHKLI